MGLLYILYLVGACHVFALTFVQWRRLKGYSDEGFDFERTSMLVFFFRKITNGKMFRQSMFSRSRTLVLALNNCDLIAY